LEPLTPARRNTRRETVRPVVASSRATVRAWSICDRTGRRTGRVIGESCGREADPFRSCPGDRSRPASGRHWSPVLSPVGSCCICCTT